MATSQDAGRMDIVTAGFGTSVAMWAIGYVTHLPGVAVPGGVVLGLMLACPVAGGMLVGRHAAAGPGKGAVVGLVTGLVNLLILGSLVTGGGDRVPSGLVWIPGSLVASAALAAMGAWIGRKMGVERADGLAWRTAFAGVATIAGLLAVVAGGLVTSLEEGLAVPDWPNSFGTNMFLYPLARMTGGIYYEHAHRLYGSLVGLTTVVLAVVLWVTDDRAWLRGLGVLAVAMVVVQGVMGGLRVTGEITLAPDGGPAPPNHALAIVHGVFGQVFLATLALIVAFTTRAWREAGDATISPRAATERSITGVLVVLVVLQISLGALYRHTATDEVPMPWSGMAHFTLALLVAIFACLAGLRAWAYYEDEPVLRRLGGAMLGLMSLQLLLGFAALIPVMARRDDWKTAEVVLATAHQANGAVVLAVTALLAVWVRRRLAVEPQQPIAH